MKTQFCLKRVFVLHNIRVSTVVNSFENTTSVWDQDLCFSMLEKLSVISCIEPMVASFFIVPAVQPRHAFKL